jgi:hypothetical protein
MRPHSLKTSAHAFLAIVAAGFLTVAPAVPTVLAQDSGASGGSAVGDAGSSVSVLLTRQNERTRLLEEDMQGLRGLVETDLRALKMQITQLSNNASSDETTTSAEIRDLRDQVERLADAVAMASRRMERTLEMTSDMEFRLLRMEKRLQTLMNFGGEELASAAVQDDTIAAGEGADVSMSRDAETGEVTWQMNESKLEEQLAAAGGSPQPDTDGADGTDSADTTGSNDATAASDVASAANANIKDAESDAAAACLPVRKFCQSAVRKSSTTLLLAGRCRTIWKPQRRPLPSFAGFTPAMNARQMRCSGLVAFSICVSNMNVPPSPFPNSAVSIPMMHELVTQRC